MSRNNKDGCQEAEKLNFWGFDTSRGGKLVTMIERVGDGFEGI
jgi:hypothetical protein